MKGEEDYAFLFARSRKSPSPRIRTRSLGRKRERHLSTRVAGLPLSEDFVFEKVHRTSAGEEIQRVFSRKRRDLLENKN